MGSKLRVCFLLCLVSICSGTARKGAGCKTVQCPEDDSQPCTCLGGTILPYDSDGVSDAAYTELKAYKIGSANGVDDFMYNCGLYARDPFDRVSFNAHCDHTNMSYTQTPTEDSSHISRSQEYLPSLPTWDAGYSYLSCSCRVKNETDVNRKASLLATSFTMNVSGGYTTNVKCELSQSFQDAMSDHPESIQGTNLKNFIVGYYILVQGFHSEGRSVLPYRDETCAIYPYTRTYPIQNGDIFEQHIYFSSAPVVMVFLKSMMLFTVAWILLN
ncbi:hypothetical protein CYMTET_30188 [Cymbomonas tetramitiformis]|uniref:Uncharacterized protein n=1 Tax=Cymbomonas tetramitiformis TaxID=36881 RepID=A0AAE0FJR9_9CHLO|nr:hypothetical protein CYMTET_30188 [Cymbomonas tetramitiformis]